MAPRLLYRALREVYRVQRRVTYEAMRRLYFQPMFESICDSVGPRCYLEVCPDSRLPVVHNARLTLGEGVRLSARTTFSGARNAPTKPLISIGDHSYIGTRVLLRAGLGITIGRRTLIASEVFISGDPGHPLDPIARRTQPAPLHTLGDIVIGDDCWIAYNAILVGNIRIGDGATVAAGSVVTKNVEAGSIVAGNPARVIKTLEGIQ